MYVYCSYIYEKGFELTLELSTLQNLCRTKTSGLIKQPVNRSINQLIITLRKKCRGWRCPWTRELPGGPIYAYAPKNRYQ